MGMREKASWRFTKAEIAAAVASAPSLRAAARQLGCNVSTISRAVKGGKVAAPARGLRERPGTNTAPTPPTSGTEPGAFEGWAVSRYVLSRVEHELIKLADRALVTAHDPAETTTGRLAAAREFRALVVALNLPKLDVDEDGDSDGDTPATIYGFPKRA
jgi:hypothetical protein